MAGFAHHHGLSQPERQLGHQRENGQFLEDRPGIGKLVGVLSLQSLPRRLTLDFRDVFSEGFAFDFFSAVTSPLPRALPAPTTCK